MKTVRLGDYINEYCEKNKKGEDIPVYSVTNTNGFCTEYFSKDVSSKDKSNYKIVYKGYFAYNPSRINVGSVDWLRNEEKVIVSPLYNVFSVSPELDNQYLYYFLKSNMGKTLIKSKAEGSVRDNLKLSILSEFPIPLPTLEEQRKVATKIDKCNEIIKQHRLLLEKYDTLIKSRFIEMFGDPVTNPKKWPTEGITEVCENIYGGGTPSKSKPEYYDGDIPWISPKDMKSLFIKDSQDHISQIAVENSSAKIIPSNSILMVIRSGILKHTLPVALNQVEVTVNQDMKAFIPNKKINPVFLLFYFKGIEKDVLSGVRAVTADNIDFNHFKQRKIILPPIDLQNDFSAFVQQIDKSKFEIWLYINMCVIIERRVFVYD